jgi:hypothetical protein
MRFPRVVLGYHGCLEPLATELLTRKRPIGEWPVSRNTWDWLGEGIYFWEHGPGRARRWAEEKAAKVEDGAVPAVVGAVIQLGDVLDLTDVRFTPLIRATYDLVAVDYASKGLVMPENRGPDSDRKRRDRDCLVINEFFRIASGTPFQAVRGAFEEGDPIFEGSKIRQETHIQIAVRDPSVILGLFLPTG